MFERTDFAFDVYGPLVRFAFSVWSLVRTALALSGTDRLFQLLRRALLAPPAVRTTRSPVADIEASAPVNVDAILETIVGPGGCPGMAVVALRGDRIVAQGVAGFRKRGDSERITLDDRFHLGSCGKAITATLAAILIEEGRLDWVTTLPEIFGDVVKNMHPAWKDVTLRQVLAHRAGLPRDTSRALRARLISSLADFVPATPEKCVACFIVPAEESSGSETGLFKCGLHARRGSAGKNHRRCLGRFDQETAVSAARHHDRRIWRAWHRRQNRPAVGSLPGDWQTG